VGGPFSTDHVAGDHVHCCPFDRAEARMHVTPTLPNQAFDCIASQFAWYSYFVDVVTDIKQWQHQKHAWSTSETPLIWEIWTKGWRIEVLKVAMHTFSCLALACWGKSRSNVFDFMAIGMIKKSILKSTHLLFGN
jgi:hypothetical protein